MLEILVYVSIIGGGKHFCSEGRLRVKSGPGPFPRGLPGVIEAASCSS